MNQLYQMLSYTRSEAIEHFVLPNGNYVEILPDLDPFNPREEDNLGHIVYWSRNYELGDERLSPEITQQYADLEELESRFLRGKRKAIVLLPIKVYDHSGVTISADPMTYMRWPDQQWDVAQCGFIYTTKKRCEELGVDPTDTENIAKQLVGEIEEFDRYLRGEAYGYIEVDIWDNDVDSCWGFGSVEEAKAEAIAGYE